MAELRTARLLLRQWRDSDLAPWAALNADPSVREHFDGLLTREQSADAMRRFRTELATRGWGLWAVETGGEFIGFTGMHPVPEGMPFGGVEIGWRLARSAWGHGYATEAATACLRYAFEELGLPELVSFTATTNRRSEAVMRRIGMVRDQEFDHPRVPPGPLRRHVLYRVKMEQWRTS